LSPSTIVLLMGILFPAEKKIEGGAGAPRNFPQRRILPPARLVPLIWIKDWWWR